MVLMEGENLLSRPVVCTQCENAFCMHSCPVEAISRQADTGAVIVDKDKCISCGDCVEACPDGMIKLDAQEKADKCDLCGGDPLCVRYCTPGALKLVTLVTKGVEQSD
jgi:Fe-S-cluster-containing hydrogenase component 2